MIITNWQARHGLTAATYQAEFDELTNKGYRLVKVSGYDLNGEPRYAGIWYMQQGNPWQARHGISEADYQTSIDTLRREGYRPVDISVFRSQERTLFNAIWEEEAGLPWIARHRLTASQYQNLFDDLSASGYRLRCVSPYEDAEGERYACIWDKYNGPAWAARHGLTAGEYQQEFDAQLERGFRLVRVVGYTIGGGTRYAAIWEHSPGHPWAARHGVPHGGYQQEFNDKAAAGLHLVDLSGYRAGSSAEYTTIWEDSPERDFKRDPVNGIVVPFMQKWAVPGFSLAVARNGSLQAVRCLGYANRITREIVTPDCRFRLASVSKPITSSAIHWLVEQGNIALTDRVFGQGAILGTVYGTQAYSAWLRAITVQHLLEHSAGGWINDGNDPMFQQPAMSQSALISWTLDNQPLTAAPGTQYGYSNFGYCLLGRIIEVSGQSYRDFVQQTLLTPSGAGQMLLAGKSAAERSLPEAMYFGYRLAAPYELPVDRMDAHGGWAGSPSDVLRFLFRVDGFAAPADLLQPATVTAMTAPSAVNPGSPTMPGYGRGWSGNNAGTAWHDGTLPGSQAIMVRVADQREWCAVCNTGRPNTQLGPEFDNLMWQVQGVL